MAGVNTVKAAWESYERLVMPDDAQAVQVLECRRAFYSGAAAMHAMALNAGGEDVSEDEGMRRIDAWAAELRRFVIMMNMGRA